MDYSEDFFKGTISYYVEHEILIWMNCSKNCTINYASFLGDKSCWYNFHESCAQISCPWISYLKCYV